MKPRTLCSECQREIQWGERFCPGCGNPIEWPVEASPGSPAAVSGETKVCAKCGSLNSVDSEFCNSCGAKQIVPKRAVPVDESAGQVRKQEKQRKRPEGRSNARSFAGLFSWKIIFGFLGALLLVVVGVEIFSPRDQSGAQISSSADQTSGASAQLTDQIADLEKRVTASPDDMQSVLTLANMCQDARQFDKAILYYGRYIGKNPGDANALVDMGVCYFETGRLDEARARMETALKYDPKLIQAHFNLGIVNLRAGRVQEANDWFKKTIALAPNSDMGKQAKQILDQHSSPPIPNK